MHAKKQNRKTTKPAAKKAVVPHAKKATKKVTKTQKRQIATSVRVLSPPTAGLQQQYNQMSTVGQLSQDLTSRQASTVSLTRSRATQSALSATTTTNSSFTMQKFEAPAAPMSFQHRAVPTAMLTTMSTPSSHIVTTSSSTTSADSLIQEQCPTMQITTAMAQTMSQPRSTKTTRALMQQSHIGALLNPIPTMTVFKRHFAAAETLADDSVEVPPHLEKKYKRLMFQATQRGWLELDLIFTAYVATFKKDLLSDEKQLDYLTEVCDCDNSDLVRWFVEGRQLPDEWKKNPVMVHMLDYALQPSKPWYPKGGNQ